MFSINNADWVYGESDSYRYGGPDPLVCVNLCVGSLLKQGLFSKHEINYALEEAGLPALEIRLVPLPVWDAPITAFDSTYTHPGVSPDDQIPLIRDVAYVPNWPEELMFCRESRSQYETVLREMCARLSTQ